MIPDKPKGGTELMYDELISRIDPTLLKDISIFNYISQADFNKTTVYWNQLSYDQEAVQFLKDTDLQNKIDYFVFVSHWQAEQFRKMFNIPGYKTFVIKNACGDIEAKTTSSVNDIIKICYTSTPWRGLEILLQAWEELNLSNCELHVFSSTKIYGKDFHFSTDNNYVTLYEKAKSLKNVVYRDYVDNVQLRLELPTFDILAYPCVFEETSCISVIEALSAGLKVVCSNIGALPETTEGWADMYTIKIDSSLHKEQFQKTLLSSINNLRTTSNEERIVQQTKTYRDRWSWNNRIEEWKDFLQMVNKNIEQSKLIASTQSQNDYQFEDLHGEYEYSELSSSDIVIDIGSNNGLFAKHCLDKGVSSVFCFEPSPSCQAELGKLTEYPNVQIINKAVWSKSDLNIAFQDGNNALSTAFTRQGNYRVQTVSLDHILDNFEKVKLLKINAVGAEYPILMNCTQLQKVEEIVGVIYDIEAYNLEYPLSYNKVCSKIDLFNFLELNNYQIQIKDTTSPHAIIFSAKKT